MRPASRRRRGTVAVAGLGAALVASLLGVPAADAFVDAELIDADVVGTVFVDYDRDGRVDPGETAPALVGGQRITVASPNRQERARTDADGTFELSLPNLVAADGVETGLRVEIDTPIGHAPSFGTAPVQHVRVRDGDRVEVLFGFVPDSRCPDDPVSLGDPSGRFPDGHPNSALGKLWTTCFVQGSSRSTEGAQDVLVAANVDTGAWATDDPAGFGAHLDVEHLATKQQMGSVWGLAHDEWDGVLFTSAVVKRHSGLGPEGVDGLYWRSSDAASPTIWSVGLDELSPAGAPGFGEDPPDCPRAGDDSYDYSSWTFADTAVGRPWDCRDLDGAFGAGVDAGDTSAGGTQSFDWWAFDRVGRYGIGDIDVTPDGRRLLVLNATADAVFVYDITSIGPDLTASATVGSPRYLVHHGVVLPECVRGRTEAWGLRAIDATAAYVGATCTGESSGSVDDLFSQVVRLDLADGASAVEATLSHDHPHGPGYVDAVGPNMGRYQPWLAPDAAGRPVLPPIEEAAGVRFLDFLEAYGYSNTLDWTQPLLSDIEVDPADGSLVLAVMDRWSMTTGVFNCDLDPSDGECGAVIPAPPPGDYDGEPGDDPVAGYTGGLMGYVAGDLVRACNVSGDPDRPRFEIEGSPTCDPRSHSPRYEEPFGGGPAGAYEWYWNDQAFAGGVPSNPHPEGSQGGAYQPHQSLELVYSSMNPTESFGAGLSRDAHADGAHVAGIQFFRTDFRNGDGTGWKSASLGDVDGCTVPLEIGDHIWFDESVDGIRDPDEPPIGGIDVLLVDAATGDTVASTVSDADGGWSFGSIDGLRPLTDYVLRFDVGRDVSVGEVTSFELVPTVYRTPDARADLDSDLVPPESNGLPLEIPIRTGGPGQSDHTIDAGFASINVIGAPGAVVDDDDRSGPPWSILGALFAGIAVLAAIAVVVLRRFVW